jgi:hypothetical protein
MFLANGHQFFSENVCATPCSSVLMETVSPVTLNDTVGSPNLASSNILKLTDTSSDTISKDCWVVRWRIISQVALGLVLTWTLYIDLISKDCWVIRWRIIGEVALGLVLT